MEFVILGLLFLKPQTIYTLNKAFKDSISLFYSASLGSINSAIKRLLKKEWISVEERVENGRNKKVYTITPTGQVSFQEWLKSRIPEEHVKDPALTRLFFMGLQPNEERIQLLEGHMNTIRATIVSLNTILAQVERIELPDEKREIGEYQKRTLQYGIAFYNFNLNWYKSLLNEIKD